MRVMTFNLGGAYDVSADPRPGWSDRRPLATKLLRRQFPDVVGFQEFDDQHLAWLEDDLPDYDVVPGLPGDRVERPMSNPVAWRRDRWQATGNGGWYLNEDRRPWQLGWDATYIRTATWVVLRERASHRSALVVNLHLDHIGETSRQRGLRLVLDLVDEQNASALPVILLGDFNANASGPSGGAEGLPSRTDTLLPVAVEAGYTDAFARPAEAGGAAGQDDASSFTYHGYEGLDYDPARHHQTGRIDWILVRDLEPTSYTRVTDGAAPDYPSDHWPVLAELGW